MLVIGAPNPNVNGLKAEFRAIFGSEKTDEEFFQWYGRRKLLEIIQCVGRQRVQRYPNQEFVVEFLNEGDLWLKEIAYLFGCKYKSVTAFEESVGQVTTPSQKTRLSILNAAWDILTEGGKLTQKAIADRSGLSPSTVCENIKAQHHLSPYPERDTGTFFQKFGKCYRDYKAAAEFPKKSGSNPYTAMAEVVSIQRKTHVTKRR